MNELALTIGLRTKVAICSVRWGSSSERNTPRIGTEPTVGRTSVRLAVTTNVSESVG